MRRLKVNLALVGVVTAEAIVGSFSLPLPYEAAAGEGSSQRAAPAAAAFRLALQPGQTVHVATSVTLPILPPDVDVVFSLDLSGNMKEELAEVRAAFTDTLAQVDSWASGQASDLGVGVVSHEDYIGRAPTFVSYYDSHGAKGCDYAEQYGDDYVGDAPFRLDQPVTSDFDAAAAAVNVMKAKNGMDEPESFGRVVWEAGQPDSGIGWREGSLRLLVMFAGGLPHDCDLSEGLSGTEYDPTGIDPGRNAVIDFGGDDIDWQDDAIPALKSADVRLIVVESTEDGYGEPFWAYWAAETGGSYARMNADGSLPNGQDLSGLLLDAVQRALSQPAPLSAESQGCEPPGGLMLDVDAPPEAAPGATIAVAYRISVPPETPPGEYTCFIRLELAGARVYDLGIEVLVYAPGKVEPAGIHAAIQSGQSLVRAVAVTLPSIPVASEEERTPEQGGGEIELTVAPDGCEPLHVEAPSPLTGAAGALLSVPVEIAVPEGTEPVLVECAVAYLANGQEFARQRLTVQTTVPPKWYPSSGLGTASWAGTASLFAFQALLTSDWLGRTDVSGLVFVNISRTLRFNGAVEDIRLLDFNPETGAYAGVALTGSGSVRFAGGYSFYAEAWDYGPAGSRQDTFHFELYAPGGKTVFSSTGHVTLGDIRADPAQD